MGLHIFTLVGIPVHVSIWFFVLLGYYAWRIGPREGLVFGAAACLSILVHEFGHALVARRFRLAPYVELHGFGGLTHHQRADRDRDDVLILIAGPGAGLVFGGLIYAVTVFAPSLAFSDPILGLFVRDLLFINIVWSFVNLIPLWPLDGGQLLRIGLIQIMPPVRAERLTHMIGLGTGLVSIYLAFQYFGGGIVLWIAVLLTVQNVTRMSNTGASGPIRFRNRFAKRVLTEANEAFDRRDWADAARLAQQVRSLENLDAQTLARLWEILSVASVELGEYEEAWSYIQRAKLQGPVVFARAKAIVALDKQEEAAQLLDHAEVASLPPRLKGALEALAARPASAEVNA